MQASWSRPPPPGYRVEVAGGRVTSEVGASLLTDIADAGADEVFVKVWSAGRPEPPDEPGGRANPLRLHPTVVGWRPACSTARDGPQTGWTVPASSTTVPADPRASSTGVTGSSWPYAPQESGRCWSVRTTTMVGCAIAAPYAPL